LNWCNIFDVDRSDTPARLVAAAERLFADGGEAATSLRAVARLAHANAAAVHYHFGGRDELLRAVVDRYRRPLAERRLRLLDEAGRAAPVTVAGVLTALVRPDLELLAKLRRHKVEIARFLGRDAVRVAPDPTDPLAMALLRPLLPDLPAAEVSTRLALLRLTVAALFAAAPDPSEPGPLGLDSVDQQVRALVGFAAAGLTAPAAQRERGRKRRRKSDQAIDG
jgi:AcrR family transcriptional regulator